MKKILGILVAAGAVCLALTSAQANTITFGSGGPSASATFVTSANSLSITLKNLTADPRSVADCLSAIGFSITTGQNAGSLSSSAGMERSVADNGTYTDGSTMAAGWVLTAGSSWALDVLAGTGHAGPAHTLIGAPDGSNVYGFANNSITGNGPHNPFLAGPLTFTLSISGLTADSSIKMNYFQFGTQDGSGQVQGTPLTQSVPDGGMTALLLGAALSGLVLMRRKLS